MGHTPTRPKGPKAMKKRKFREYAQRATVFTVQCSVASACDGEHEFEGPTAKDVEREMIADGWLDDFIVEDTINLACGACVQHCKDNVGDFEELDVRAGGKAS